MIGWRTILGLIMAGKWLAPESQSACRSSMTDAGARDQRKQFPRCAVPAPRDPRHGFMIARCGRPPPTTMRPICQNFTRGAVVELNRSDWEVGRELSKQLPLRTATRSPWFGSPSNRYMLHAGALSRPVKPKCAQMPIAVS
jgi:hypothetical protein